MNDTAAKWRDLASEQPADGDMVLASDGHARWVDYYLPWIAPMTWNGHAATLWYPIPPLPTAVNDANG